VRASIADGIYLFFCAEHRGPQLAAFFSVRLDEAGTGGHHKYAVVAGAVGSPAQWKEAESRWENLLRRSKLKAYHDCDFQDRAPPYRGWTKLKSQRFVDAQEKIIRNHTAFEVAVAVDRADHARIKHALKGVKGFKADSDYSLALRVVMFVACGHLAGQVRDPLVQIIVEDGPWSAGAYEVYQTVKNTHGSWKPSPHAHMLAGFNALPKGAMRGLEMADYLAGRAIRDLDAAERPPSRKKQTFVLANEAFLAKWHEGILKGKEHRRAYAKNRFKKPSSSQEQPS
jgi:hypothetical protein